MDLNPARWLARGDVTGQCMGLAGLFQAVSQLQACAREGAPSDPQALRSSLESVLRIDAPDPAGVYGGIRGLHHGLEVLTEHLARRMNATRLEQARYVANLMFLERRLADSPAVTAALGDVATHGSDSPWMQRQLAELYVSHVSSLGPRILVSGEPAYLKSDEHANRIRALLLAGLRAAVLWRQCGGSRLRLTLHRAALAETCARLLEEARARGS